MPKPLFFMLFGSLGRCSFLPKSGMAKVSQWIEEIFGKVWGSTDWVEGFEEESAIQMTHDTS